MRDYFGRCFLILRGVEMSTLVVAIGLPEEFQRPTRGQAVPRPSTSLSVTHEY